MPTLMKSEYSVRIDRRVRIPMRDEAGSIRLG
jgi:hypothetical protein